MKTAGGHLCSRGHGSQCSEPNQDTNSADRHRNGTGTLQDDEHKTRKTDKPTAAIRSVHGLFASNIFSVGYCLFTTH